MSLNGIAWLLACSKVDWMYAHMASSWTSVRLGTCLFNSFRTFLSASRAVEAGSALCPWT